MSKSDFVNGDTLNATFVDTIYSTGGGHDHKGLDYDGSAQKIDLTSMVVNQLPDANIQSVQASKMIGTVNLNTQTSGNPNVWMTTANLINGLDLNSDTSGGTGNIVAKTGVCADSTNTYTLQLGAAYSGGNWLKNIVNSAKTAALAWAVGPTAGGHYTTSLSAGWLYVFAIAQTPVTGTWATPADIGTDISATASNLLAATGYTLYRRIGAIYITGTSGSYAIAPFSAKNGKVTYLPQIDTSATEVAGQVLTSAYTTIAAAIPPIPTSAKILVKSWNAAYTSGYVLQDGASGLDCIKISCDFAGSAAPVTINVVDIGRTTSGITIKGSTGYAGYPTVAISVLGYTDYRGA